MEIEAGRKLDALIAEKVFGKTSCLCAHGCACDIHDGPNYSSDIKVAWQIVELLNFMIHPCGAGPDGKPAGYWVGYPRDGHVGLVGDMENETVAFAETASHAICLAALKVAEALADWKV